MRVKDGFMIRKIVDQWMVVPLGERVVDFNGMLTLSESAALLWNRLAEKPATRDDLLRDLLAEYEVTEGTAARDLDEFLGFMEKAGLLES